VERIASTYRLTEPVLKKVAALTREFVALARTDPSIVKADDDSGTSVSAAVRAIFTRVGIREEEYENFSIASAFAALGTWAAGQSREVAEAAKEMPPITRANMAFLKTHAAALKAIEQDVMLLKEMAEAPSKDPPGSR
jgi:hypothetical protein